MSFEVEIKIFLSDEERKTIENYFETSSQFTGKYSQIDHYFDTTEPSFAKLDKALRVRFQNRNDQGKIERKIELTFKGPKLHSDSKTRKEINLIVENDTEFETIESFLNELGFIHSFKIEKDRKSWIKDNIHFFLDKNLLGYFLEAEMIVNENKLIYETEDKLWANIKNIIGDISKDRKITKSYLELILESKKNT